MSIPSLPLRNRPLALGLLVLLPLAAGCLEPGPTPLGVENAPVALPDEAIRLELGGAALNLRLTRLDGDPVPLFETEVLYCGVDPVSGFRAEPIFRFDTGEFADPEFGLDGAGLLPAFTVGRTDSLWRDDNPDLASETYVRILRLPDDLDLEADTIERLDAIAGAYPLDPDAEPVLLEGSTPIALPADSLAAWIADDLSVILGLEFVDAASEPGLKRLVSTRSSDTPVVLQGSFVGEDDDSVEPELDGIAALKDDLGGEFADRLFLATGIQRDAHLIFDLPDTLQDPAFLFVQAALLLYPDSSGLMGMGPDDREDNLISGLYLNEGGLTLNLRAVDDSLPGSTGIEDGTLLEDRLALFEQDIDYSDDDSEQISATNLREPFRLPLTDWLQQWANGEDENFGITLRLDGAEERLRQVEWHFHAADPELAPRLEILYLRRPDFD